jgi:hypothetical protein
LGYSILTTYALFVFLFFIMLTPDYEDVLLG